MAILITGFSPFGDVTENPSALVAQAVASVERDVDHAVLPTEYGACVAILAALVDAGGYDACIALGVGDSETIHIERLAYNLDDTTAPDNAWSIRTGLPIVPNGPETLQPTLPIDAMYAAVAELGIPVSYSDDPGRYVCNHLFYATLHALAASGSRTQFGFVHLPMHAEAGRDGPALPLETMIRAVAACVRAIHLPISPDSHPPNL